MPNVFAAGFSMFSLPKVEKGRCDVETPELTEIVPGSHHRVACFHPEGMDEMPIVKKEELAVSSPESV